MTFTDESASEYSDRSASERALADEKPGCLPHTLLATPRLAR